MTKETRRISPDDERILFADGTELLVAPVTGEATLWSADVGSSRLFAVPAEEDSSEEFRRGLEALGILQQQSLHLDLEGFSGQPGYDAAGRKQSVILRPPPGKASTVQVVLFQDESGGLSWHFPDGFFDAAPEKKSDRAEFTISTRTLAAQEAIQTGMPFPLIPQGPITKQGRNVFKVLAIPAAGEDDAFARLEERQHGYCLRGVGVGDYRQTAGTPFSGWQSLAGKRSLLVIHDLFSSVGGMLSSMSATDVAVLCDSYEGRVIGFDHPTLSQTPEQNARFLIEALNGQAPEGEFEFDVIAHGRGGIVARTLAQRGEELGASRLRLRKILMAGAPNLGTPLANPERLPDLLNVFTNLHANFPEGPALYPLQLLTAVVAQLARNPRAVIPGIAAMSAPGYVQEVLNGAEPPDTVDYASVTADFLPDPAHDNAFLTSTFKVEVVERVFAAGNTLAQNDLLVPTETLVYPKSNAVRSVLTFKPEEHVCHTAYFTRPKTFEMIRTYFGLSDPASTSPAEQPAGEESFIAKYLNDSFRVGGREIGASTGGGSFGHSQEGLIAGRGAGHGGMTRGGALVDSEDDGLLIGHTGRRAEPRDLSREMGEAFSEAMDLDAGSIAAVVRGVSGEEPAWPSWNRPSASPTPTLTTATAPGAEKEETVQRTPKITMPDLAGEGETIDVTVSLSQWSAGGSSAGPISIRVPAAAQEVSVVVRLKANGFRVVDGESARAINIRRGQIAGAESVSFKLMALSPGSRSVEREVSAEFWQDNARIGWVAGHIRVIPAKPESPRTPPPSSFSLIEDSRRQCDLILVIDEYECGGGKVFELQAQSNIAGEKNNYLFRRMGRLQVNSRELADMLASYIDFNAFPQIGAAQDIDFWRKRFGHQLKLLGGVLWDLLPRAFQDEYFRLRETGNLRSIWVHSGEVVFPWELVRPYKEDLKLGTLGQEHVLGRWLPHLNLRPSPQQMKVGKMVILNPSYSEKSRELPWSGDEARALEEMFRQIATAVTPVDLQTVQDKVLASSDVQVLHFTGHGDIREINADLNYLMLSDRELHASELVSTTLGHKAHPFLVLNACSVGMTNIVVGRAGGFPAKCLNGGFSGLLAPYWPVLDRSAMDFSLGLYRLLKQMRPIGEALHELRVNNPDDPTFQAYAFFGDPWARLLFQ